MSKKGPALLLAISLSCLFLAASSSRADGGDEILQPHPLAIYPGSVPESTSHPVARLTKDGLETVQAFFSSKFVAGDKLEPYEQDTERGFVLNYHKMIGKREQSAFEARFTARHLEHSPLEALGELAVQVKLGHHTEAEYQAMEKEYGGLCNAYYREVKGDDGKTAREGDLIYRRYAQQAHPDSDRPAGPSPDDKQRAKAKAAEIKKQMKALKAKGDIAGMMKLAQENRDPKMEAMTRAQADQVMNRDTWDLWVKCLAEMKAAAYWTRINYAESAVSGEK
jgi:hypothetical protein